MKAHKTFTYFCFGVFIYALSFSLISCSPVSFTDSIEANPVVPAGDDSNDPNNASNTNDPNNPDNTGDPNDPNDPNDPSNPDGTDGIPDPIGKKKVLHDIEISVASNKVDILFVIDNSGSMEDEQKRMADQFDTFVTGITELDWRIGITTTDTINRGKFTQGKLLNFNSDTQEADLFVLDKSVANVQSKFQNTIQRTEEGSANERGIAAAIYNLNLFSAGEYQEFYRDEAQLVIVIISDEDEGSYNTFGEPNYILPSEDTPQALLNTVSATFSPSKTLTVHSIVIQPKPPSYLADEHTACFIEQASQVGRLGQPYSQINGVDYGIVYSLLSEQTGGIIGSICGDAQNSYQSQISDIAKDITTTQDSVALECPPIDGAVRYQINGESTWIDKQANGNKLIFDPPLTEGTKVQVEYECWVF